MNCPEHEALSAYLDNMLPQPERAELSAHMHDCPVCRAQLQALSELQAALRALPSPALGFSLADRLQLPPRMAPARRRPAWQFWPVGQGWPGWTTGMGGIAVAAALAGGVWLGGAMLAGGAMRAPAAGIATVFDPVPPGGLCAAVEVCRFTKGMP